ncbi:flagellar hook protein FlgE [Colwellia sp. 1_MG-2023]|uniref:flagellar hook protein FlgE n=1 Tax=unclassified Colwellia TaxID=196834 RepID=UPI00209116DB|nr:MULTISPECIES: flagellar hook protein FlgE [unclassified Colwellia]MDO6654013.1 flagellar hook protein FlgE [Colwellia sp. 3_MG-2023]MDO6666961.1 flagellar hook protein FlgE [Colwellia sp. 2_MG-2023]MDO6691345.1 flagellar hook protein FlgE [Colwellia sp. 1_MG-2023]
MSFNIALSGLNAAQKDLDVTSNNIANVNTTGFKESRAEFVDVYATSLLSSSKTKVGDGVLTSEVAQQFSQGSIAFTTNSLDLAITGSGFFATVPSIDSLETSYTRAGEYKLNDSNFVVNSAGEYLLAFDVNSDGSSSSVALSTASPLQIPTSSGSPTKTNEVDIKMNLPAGDDVPSFAFDKDDSLTYNNATSVNIYDSLGDSHVMTYYFVKTAANNWDMHVAVDDQLVDLPGGVDLDGDGINNATLEFDSNGDFIGQVPATITTAALGAAVLTNGADPTQAVVIDFNLDTTGPNVNEPTQFASNFEVTSLEQDGLAVGRLTGIEIGTDGLVEATYSNGTATPLARIALVNFANEQGLTQIGGTSWKESITSGEPVAGEAGGGTFGEINSSALEQSNVNLTTELIDLISAQRNFQANSRSLEVDNDLNNTILQIR